ncbi:MAG: SET domain-containing protein-lysine N-methyltransferase [Saprospiraceae bacterium]|jgi:uncharacterized membrane protein YobD (UPF0266 family)
MDINIEASEYEYLYKSQSQIPNAGFGLYTAIDIYKDEIIAIYKGKILNDIEIKKRVKAGKDRYFINLLDGGILDSFNSKCFAKYANDANGISKSTLKNNAVITLDDKDRVCLMALRDIHAGEEILCSYGKKYWKRYLN